jgi:hypothetical protein
LYRYAFRDSMFQISNYMDNRRFKCYGYEYLQIAKLWVFKTCTDVI